VSEKGFDVNEALENERVNMQRLKEEEDKLFNDHKGKKVPVPELKSIFNRKKLVREQLLLLEQTKKELDLVEASEQEVEGIRREEDSIGK
jgi:hypothetical protein